MPRSQLENDASTDDEEVREMYRKEWSGLDRGSIEIHKARTSRPNVCFTGHKPKNLILERDQSTNQEFAIYKLWSVIDKSNKNQCLITCYLGEDVAEYKNFMAYEEHKDDIKLGNFINMVQLFDKEYLDDLHSSKENSMRSMFLALHPSEMMIPVGTGYCQTSPVNYKYNVKFVDKQSVQERQRSQTDHYAAGETNPESDFRAVRIDGCYKWNDGPEQGVISYMEAKLGETEMYNNESRLLKTLDHALQFVLPSIHGQQHDEYLLVLFFSNRLLF
uniref:Uncharacterized protein n=1 Tax=Clytia hemisphaerica TaxID=252671 RepID=A0A7M5VCJ4_9CNID